jgi:hypothetical protein
MFLRKTIPLLILYDGLGVGLLAHAGSLDFGLNLGGPGYAIGFSNYPQYTLWAPPPGAPPPPGGPPK